MRFTWFAAGIAGTLLTIHAAPAAKQGAAFCLSVFGWVGVSSSEADDLVTHVGIGFGLGRAEQVRLDVVE